MINAMIFFYNQLFQKIFSQYAPNIFSPSVVIGMKI
jgi:hypothetical protein